MTVLEIKNELFEADIVEDDDVSDYVKSLEEEVDCLKKKLYQLRQFTSPGGPLGGS